MAFRSIQNPNLYGDPDTYHGQYWDLNGEVHQHRAVFSHWFYIVAQGESGVNDLGNSYSVTGIGIDKAAQIAYRMLVYYLPENCTYPDARIYAILAATDLYGTCSPEVEAVTNAMYAIGLGGQYVPYVVADFASSMNQNCSAPFTIKFIINL